MTPVFIVWSYTQWATNFVFYWRKTHFRRPFGWVCFIGTAILLYISRYFMPPHVTEHMSRWVGGGVNNVSRPQKTVLYVKFTEKTMLNISLTAGWAHIMMEGAYDGNRHTGNWACMRKNKAFRGKPQAVGELWWALSQNSIFSNFVLCPSMHC